jgi:hypothetical protein
MHAFLTHTDLNFLPIPLPNFAVAIKRRRVALGLNRARAAASLGISQDLWDLIEVQGWVPSTKNEEFLRALAGTLEIQFYDLVCAIGPLEAHFAATQDQTTDEHSQADQTAA